MKISFCCPSYKREKVETFKYIPFVKCFVCESEYDNYVKANPKFKDNIIAVPLGIQGNVSRIRNYILDYEFKNGADVVVTVDDDMEGLYLWMDSELRLEKVKIESGDLMIFVEKYSILCDELGFKLWGANVNQDSRSYREYTPFSFTSFVGGPFQVFLKGNDLRYDEKLYLKEDYDMTIQNCNKFRGVLRLNFLTYNVKQSKQVGGCASQRNILNEINQFNLLQKKWGSKIVKKDKLAKKKNFDYNPIIKIPIKGV